MKSEKLTTYLKDNIIREMRRCLCNLDKESSLRDLLSETYQEIFYKEYFDGEDEISFYNRFPHLFKNFYVRITPLSFNIDVDKLIKENDRSLNHTFSFSIQIPQLFKNNENITLELIKKQDMYESFRTLYKEYIKISLHNETCCDKYFSFPQNSQYGYLFKTENFCRPCTTTSQLRELFPEVYEYYLKIKNINPEENKEKKIENLRKELGFLIINKK